MRSIVIVALFCPAVSLMAQQTSEYQLYKVAKGDNYYKLSKKFNCSAEDIQKANDNKTVLKLGETIKIPVKSIAKKDLYEKFGVREYWVIDPESKMAKGFELKQNEFQSLGSFKGQVKSKLLKTVFRF